MTDQLIIPTDDVINELLKTKKLAIKYVRRTENGGKHNAWRDGLKVFRGRYILTADDDDPILSNAIEIHNKHWSKLENEKDYDKFWEVRTRCITPDGELIGKPFDSNYIDSDYIIMTFGRKYNVEMVGSRKVEILRNEASVPNFVLENKCSNFAEAIRWIRAAKIYKTRFTSDVTRIYTPNTDGLVKTSQPSQSAKYNALVWGGYMLLENRMLLIRYDSLRYFKLIILVGYLTALLKEKPSLFHLKFPENILAIGFHYLSKLYIK